MNKTTLVFRTVAAVLLSAVDCPFVSAQVSGHTLTAGPAKVARWDELKAADSLMTVPASSRFIPEPGVGPGPRPVPSGQVQPGSPTVVPPRREEAAPGTGESDRMQSAPATVSFRAILDNNTVIPPDTYGAVGPNHVMTMLNSQVRIQSKADDTLSTVSFTTFWSSLPSSSGVFDPRVQYDALHGRWIACCAVNPEASSTKLNFAISTTSDPTGVWTFYQLPADTLEKGSANWADYPCLGFNRKWFVITANMFSVSQNKFQGVRMWAIDTASVLSGGAMVYTLFGTQFDLVGTVYGFTLQPCVTYGSGDTLYLVDNTGFFASDTTFLLRLSRITGTSTSPAWSVVPGSSFGANGLFRVANNFNATQIGAAQSGTSTLIETNDFRLLSAAYRSGWVWCTHSGGLPPKITPTPNRTAVFWYQLNPSAMPNPIVQSGVLDGGVGEHYYFPSIAANANGDACVGFTRSDASRFAEGVFTGRLAADPVGTMQAIQQLKAGESSYSKFFGGTQNRWGDYSNTWVDPTDDLTFWTIQEYGAQNVGSGVNDGRWGTWWGKIPPQLSLPIQLASFTAVESGNGLVRLDWVTYSEIDNYGFEVQRRAAFEDVFLSPPGAFVAGHGTTASSLRYSFIDVPPGGGIWYYRLKQIDLDGSATYSSAVRVSIGNGTSAAAVPLRTELLPSYPNPFNPSTTIRYTVSEASMVRLAIFDALGRQVSVLVNEMKNAGAYEVEFEASGLSSGVYFCRLAAGAVELTRKLMLVR